MLAALAFLTPLRVPGRTSGAAPGPGAVAWFPVVGALVGLVVGGLWWGADRWWAPVVAAAVAVVADLVATGALHLDGVADAGDGLLAPLDRTRRLAAMADPAVGAFGVVAVVAVLVTRWAAFAGQPAAPLVVAGLWAASRGVMAVALTTLPHARGTGLPTPMAGASPWPAAVVATALATGLVVVGDGAHGLAALVVGVAAAGAVLALGWRRLGGCTGDVLGAAGVVGETVGLVVLAVRP